MNQVHFKMASDDMAGDAKRRVPIPSFRSDFLCKGFTLFHDVNLLTLKSYEIPATSQYSFSITFSSILYDLLSSGKLPFFTSSIYAAKASFITCPTFANCFTNLGT